MTIAAQAMKPAHTSRPAPNPAPAASTPSESGANADTPRPMLKQNPAPVVRTLVGNNSPRYAPKMPA